MADGVLGQERAVGPFEDVFGMDQGTCIVGVFWGCSPLEVRVSILCSSFWICSCRPFFERAFTRHDTKREAAFMQF